LRQVLHRPDRLIEVIAEAELRVPTGPSWTIEEPVRDPRHRTRDRSIGVGGRLSAAPLGAIRRPAGAIIA